MVQKFDFKDHISPQLGDEKLWELYHENSKMTKHSSFPSQEAILEVMGKMKESVFYEHLESIRLPDIYNIKLNQQASLFTAILQRESNRSYLPAQVSIENLSMLLNYSYGINRNYKEQGFLRPLRSIPSGGGLYPLELYLYINNVENLAQGFYHFQNEKNCLQNLNNNFTIEELSKCFVQPELATNASIILFISAIFARSTFKYSERSYRFILLEAGHLMQNYNLVATALGFKSVNVGGFFDYELDKIFCFDGINQSILYSNCMGG